VIDIAEGCLQACIEGRLEDALTIPEPSEAKAGEVLVTVPIETATKAALFQTVAASGTSRVALAKAVDLDEKEIRRMLDPRHSSKLPRIEQVLKALGKQLRISLVDVVKAPRAPGAGSPRLDSGERPIVPGIPERLRARLPAEVHCHPDKRARVLDACHPRFAISSRSSSVPAS
jgi:hypothetical protein